MSQYLKQLDTFSCGVIAAMNLDIWRRKKVNRSNFVKYRLALECKRGTYRRCLTSNLKSRYQSLLDSYRRWRLGNRNR